MNVVGRIQRLGMTGLNLSAAFFLIPLYLANAEGAELTCEQLQRAGITGMQVVSVADVSGSLPVADLVPGRGAEAGKPSPHLSNLPAFCRVNAILSPVLRSRIEIELWLPKAWNGKLLAIGSHGFGGNFERGDMAMGLHRGYAVVTSDLGHSSRTSETQAGFNVGSAAFAVGNEVAIDDFAWRATHETALVAKELVKLRYGVGARRSYFDGCSNGGRQAMREAQQFPDDFDGIISGGAAMNWTRSFASTLFQYQSGTLADGTRMTLPKLQLAQKTAIAACDRTDGLVDGLVNNPPACSWKPSALLCKTGGDPSQCLTAAEVGAIERMEKPFQHPTTGEFLYDGLAPGSESYWRNMLNFNAVTANFFRYMVLNDPKWQPDATTNVFDILRQSEQHGSPGMRINSINPDLSAFRARGGKLIQYHGWNDPSFAPGYAPRYYAEVVELQSGPDKLERTQDFYRLFMTPGMAHCHGGEGPINYGALDHASTTPIDARHDILEALDLWVEKGAAPDTLIATQLASGGKPQRQMPLCAWPKTAVYVSGDPNSAASFQCRAEARKDR